MERHRGGLCQKFQGFTVGKKRAVHPSASGFHRADLLNGALGTPPPEGARPRARSTP
ncbi:hypothetical protein B4135_2697 [Caldibacillus debilis]|uniref:Uncharacterized protein n=1 Tax=Caldibacillus debilis TaxID=301148 RepID=A0A150LT06_9BACI|nr:hypothetical protein B4135_2697 [Caldibacillus debilis]